MTMAEARGAYAKAAKAYKVALDTADAIGWSGPDCLLIVLPGPCEKASVRAAWRRTQQLKWAASADAAGRFLDVLEAIRWPDDGSNSPPTVDDTARAQAGDLVNALTAHRALMVKAARAPTYSKEHDAWFAADFAARNVQFAADALRKTIGLGPVKKRDGIFFVTNAY